MDLRCGNQLNTKLIYFIWLVNIWQKTELYDRGLPHKMHNGSAWVHPRYHQLSNLYAIDLRKKLTKDDYYIWNDVRECIKQHNYVTNDWWIEQWKMWRELENNKIVSVEIKEV